MKYEKNAYDAELARFFKELSKNAARGELVITAVEVHNGEVYHPHQRIHLTMERLIRSKPVARRKK
jgi:hypothetical protein